MWAEYPHKNKSKVVNFYPKKQLKRILITHTNHYIFAYFFTFVVL